MSDQVPAGVARIVKTKRVQLVIDSSNVSEQNIPLDVVWDSPFVDSNYTCGWHVETVSPTNPINYYPGAFARDNTKMTVQIGAAPTLGDVVVVHAFAEHD